MSDKKIDELRRGFETAYIDGSIVSNESLRPQFVSNNYKEGKKVLSSIEDIPTKFILKMLENNDFYNMIEELVEFGIGRYERDYS